MCCSIQPLTGPKELLLRLVELHFPLPPDPDAPEDEEGAPGAGGGSEGNAARRRAWP